ncbi:MAG: peptidoglycan DD-metalloendopeptidase family protein [Flavobacterium sp.]
MSKNSIHNFNLSIKNTADIKSSEDLTKTIIKELAKVSKEMNEQKDILQMWQEQKNQNAALFANNFNSLSEGGAINTTDKTIKLISNTSSDSEEKTQNLRNLSSNALIEGGVTDIIGKTTTSSSTLASITPSSLGVENNTLNFSRGTTAQTYGSVALQQTITIPQTFQQNSVEPSIEVIKAAIKKEFEAARKVNDSIGIEYWISISNAFDGGATAQDFNDKPDNILFTQMYTTLKQSNPSVETQNFNWEVVRTKMIESIDANILNDQISSVNKERWRIIKKQLSDDTTNIANLFEQYDELFLLLKEVHGLDALPNTITIITKTKIYPNLSADKLYASIGKEDVYVFLREISNDDIRGSAIDKGAVKIKNTIAKSFIIGESLEFFLDEKFVNQNLYKKENINWIVRNIKNKNDKGIVFANEGTSFNYNFYTAGVYRIDAFGYKPTINGNKCASTATFVELEIIAQQIVIKSPFKEGVTRASVKEQLFKVALKNTNVKTLNPLKLYYQLEVKTANRATKISEEQELDTTGIIKLTMPDLGKYKIKVFSKDQYALTQESVISVIKNEVMSIGQVENTPNNNVFLLGNQNSTLTLETKTFRINPPTDAEREDVKWMIYDVNNKPYLSSGSVIMTKNNDPKKAYLHQWSQYNVPIPQKVGHYIVEAYSDIQKGSKAKSVFKFEVQQPQVSEACWTFRSGSKKQESGFSGESNWIKANIPHYSNQTVRIYFYLNTIKTNYYCDVITNENDEIFKEIKFDSDFKKHIGFQNRKNAKIGFKILGIQNGKPYPFKTPANYESNTVLSVVTDLKILDAYFEYDGIRVNPFIQVPYGATVKGIVKTLNMVGSEVVLKVRRKDAQHSQLKMKTIVKSEGEASITFVLDKKWRPITPLFGMTDSYYLEIQGVESKFYLENGLNAVVGAITKPKKNMEIIFPLLEKPINDTNSKWGKNYNWSDDDGHNQATFDSNRDSGNRKHAARDLYTEPNTKVVAIADGKVLEARDFYAGTYQVTVLHKLKDGRKFIARYGELKPNSIKVKKGDIIKQESVIGRTGKLQGKSVITGQNIYMLHFEIFSAEKGENLNSPLTDKFNGSPFQRREDLLDSIDILLEGYKNTFEINKGDRREIKSLRLSDKGKQFIKDWESFKKKMYDNDGDTNSEGNCTIGYGHKIHDGKCDGSASEDKFKNGVSDNEASRLFEKDILIFEKAVRNKIKMPLYQYEFDALVSYVYNIGQAFKAPNLIKYINSNNYASAVSEIETGYQNVKRRKQERDMFSKGIYDSVH